MKKLKPIHTLCYALVGLAIFFFAAFRFGLFDAVGAVKIFGLLSDAFLMPGILLSGVAAISWTGALGTYDMIGYGMQTLFFFIPSVFEKRAKSFYDYRRAKEEKGRKWLFEMLIVGLVFLVLSAASLIVSLLL